MHGAMIVTYVYIRGTALDGALRIKKSWLLYWLGCMYVYTKMRLNY